SPQGNLFADLMREARADADVAIINGGSLRADLPPGELTFGALFEALPFDNRISTVRLRGRDLRALLEHHFESQNGLWSVSGIRVRVACASGHLSVHVERNDGAEIRDSDALVLAASDFLLTGGDDFWNGAPAPDVMVSDELVRDALLKGLHKRS